MKKIILSSLLLSLIAGTTAFAQDDWLYEMVRIPSYSESSVPSTKKVGIKKQQIDNKNIKKEDKTAIYEQATVESNIYEPIMNMIGKYKNEIKVIYADIDGIIAPENYSGTTYRDKTYNAFDKLNKNNILFIFTTGRTFREAKRVANQLNINPKYYITQNGAEIVDSEGNIIYENPMNFYYRKKMNKEVNCFNYFYNQDLKIAFYQRGQVYTYTDSDIPNLIDIPIEIDRLSQIPVTPKISKIKIYGNDAHNLDMFKRYLTRYYKFLRFDSVSSNTIDITMKNSNKANAVSMLSEKLGIKLQNSAAFGYAENDIDLINLLRLNGGLAISNENSYQKVKDISSYITKDLDSDGFAFAIDTIIGNNQLIRNN